MNSALDEAYDQSRQFESHRNIMVSICSKTQEPNDGRDITHDGGGVNTSQLLSQGSQEYLQSLNSQSMLSLRVLEKNDSYSRQDSYINISKALHKKKLKKAMNGLNDIKDLQFLKI